MLPALAVDADADGRLVLLYYSVDLRRDLVCAFLTFSKNRGGTWSTPRALSPRPMKLAWIPRSGKTWRSEGLPMLGDYFWLELRDGGLAGALTLASRPRTRFRVGVYALLQQ